MKSSLNAVNIPFDNVLMAIRKKHAGLLNQLDGNTRDPQNFLKSLYISMATHTWSPLESIAEILALLIYIKDYNAFWLLFHYHYASSIKPEKWQEKPHIIETEFGRNPSAYITAVDGKSELFQSHAASLRDREFGKRVKSDIFMWYEAQPRFVIASDQINERQYRLMCESWRYNPSVAYRHSPPEKEKKDFYFHFDSALRGMGMFFVAMYMDKYDDAEEILMRLEHILAPAKIPSNFRLYPTMKDLSTEYYMMRNWCNALRAKDEERKRHYANWALYWLFYHMANRSKNSQVSDFSRLAIDIIGTTFLHGGLDSDFFRYTGVLSMKSSVSLARMIAASSITFVTPEEMGCPPMLDCVKMYQEIAAKAAETRV